MKKNLKFIILGFLMVALILGYYYYISNKRTVNDIEDTTINEVTIVDQLLLKNIEKNYPPTPREVLKLYADITVAFYTQEYTEEQKRALAMKIRELYDDELIAANPEIEYLEALYKEIDTFKSQGITFSSYAVCSATDVDYFTKDGRDIARADLALTVKQGTEAGITKETFILRKDELGHYKIYGWALAKED